MKTQYKQLNLEDREKIAILRAKGLSVRAVANLLGRHHSTVLRELSRNSAPVNHGYYLPSKANIRASDRKTSAGKRKRLKSDIIRNYVESKLVIGWSPEQIAGRLPMEIDTETISHEAIYQYIYLDAPYLKIHLARKHRKRLIKAHYRRRKNAHFKGRTSIDLRPLPINSRKDFGHWEADSIVSKRDSARLNVLVERKSRFVQITKIKNGAAWSTHIAIQSRLLPLPQYARKSITYDNGIENTEHVRTNQTLNTQSYFCHPYHSWEKGTVENTAGLIRRFVPKGASIQRFQDHFIHHIEFLLNNRPRKCLEFHTPAEVFNFFGGALPG